MLPCYSLESGKNNVKIDVVNQSNYSAWLKDQSKNTTQWIAVNKFDPKPGKYHIIPDENGNILKVVFIAHDNMKYLPFGILSSELPTGTYELNHQFDKDEMRNIAIVWAMGAYVFSEYNGKSEKDAKLVLSDDVDVKRINETAKAIYLIRDLINTPAEDMGPRQLAEIVEATIRNFDADLNLIVGDDLLVENYPVIHAVGRASIRRPRLIDFTWGKPDAPKVTLVGKGVCFDTGGLDLKSSNGMYLMKKDMGGAAHVLALGVLIMSLELPVRLRVLIPAVENSVSGSALRPTDIINSRKGITIEVKNTDAEGRLILCDAIAEAVSENPDLLIDMATLTGAAKVALGGEIAAFFTNNEDIASKMSSISEVEQDHLWRLPLFEEYRSLLDSNIANISNASLSAFTPGAIVAALFLKEFVPDHIPWMHFDIMAWNMNSKPGKPEGGEALCIRTLLQYLLEHFG